MRCVQPVLSVPGPLERWAAFKNGTRLCRLAIFCTSDRLIEVDACNGREFLMVSRDRCGQLVVGDLPSLA
jgi:hypothetical protein